MKAAQVLIRGETTHLRLGHAVYIFWTREPSAFSAASLLSSPDPNYVREMLHGAFKGKEFDVDPTPFYAAALSASGARAVVRDWIDTTVGEARRNLARFFALQHIVDAWEDSARPLGIYALSNATVRRGDESAPWVPTRLLRCALQGGPLPQTLLFKAVERCRVESGVTRHRAALIKMAMLTQRPAGSEEGDGTMVELDLDNRDPAYLCGRLFAELEAVQRQALGDVGAGIVARYYGTASSAPATVFGRLVRGAQPHLTKLRRDRPGAYRALDERLQEIQSGLQRYPATLTLLEQGMFALGYYHQRAADRIAARRRKGNTDDTEDTMEAAR
jgi:CRISPR-associated protein Csd1